MMDKTEQRLWNKIYENWRTQNRLKREAHQLYLEADYKHLLDNEGLQEAYRDQRHQIEQELTDHYRSLGLSVK